MYKLNVDKDDNESSLSVNTRKRETEREKRSLKRVKNVRLTILSEQKDRKSFHPSIS